MPPTASCRKESYSALSTVNGPPEPKWLMMERHALCMASVAIMAGMCPFVTSRPLMVPMTTPNAQQNSSITTALPVLFSTSMPKPPMMASWAPTEMSICPAEMTMLMPIAIRPTMELCTKRFVILVQEKKFGFTQVAITRSKIRERIKLYSFTTILKNSFGVCFFKDLSIFRTLHIRAGRIVHHVFLGHFLTAHHRVYPALVKHHAGVCDLVYLGKFR